VYDIISSLLILSNLRYRLFILFLKCLAVGFVIAAPIGPIGTLCIQRSLHYGFWSGFSAGFGAALADGTFGAIAAFGLTAITYFVLGYRPEIQLVGGIILVVLGLVIFIFKAGYNKTIKIKAKNNVTYLLTTYAIAISNPATILGFIAIFAALGLGSKHNGIGVALLMTAGVFLGSLFWWFLLSGISSRFKSKMTEAKLFWVNRISGIILIIFGAVCILTI
jgi:threonine/homoserine/homoserine lactone efflux protein